jgi:hypothetical protein
MADDLKTQILDRKGAAEDYLSTKRDLWDEYEDLFNGTLADNLSGKASSQVFDHKLSTQILERSARVMSQLAVGKVKAISKNDEGASKLMNLVLDKYVVPNASSQFDFLTKLRMVDTYSNIYGNYFAMVDWDIRKNGYNGPDLFLLPIRDVFPQVGAISLEDSDYVIVRSYRPLSWFKSLGKGEYKNLSAIIAKLSNKAGDKQKADKKSQREENDHPGTNEAKGKGYFEVLSMYEKDRWVDWVTSADLSLRDMKNPQDNDELPIVNKYSIPLVDDFMGMGDMERGKTMQYTVNSMWNLYLDAVKVSIFPPTLINKDSIADASSIKWAQAAKWLVKGQVDNAARVLNLSPQGINTFNNTYQMASASLMNMFGTTDTSMTKDQGQEFGRTPQALQMQAQRENSRDNVDRYYMEQFVTKVMKKFVNLVSKKMSGNVAIRMFEPEIEEIAIQYPEIKEMWNEKTGKLMVKKGSVGSLLYDYEIVSGSTYAIDQKAQQENLMNLFQSLTNGATAGPTGITSPVIELLKQDGKTPKIGELFTRIISNGGIQDWNKIIVDTKDDPDALVQQDQQIFMQALQQAGGMNQIPPQPGQQPGMPQGMPQPMNEQPSPETQQPF